MHFSSLSCSEKCFFLEFRRLMFQKSFFIMVQTSTDLWVSCSILRLRCLNSFLCLIQKPFFARRTTPLIRLIESRKMLITPFQNIFVLFHFQSEFNYNVKVDEKHTIEVVFLVSIQLIAALEIGLTFLYFHLSQISRNNSKVSYN